MCRASSAPSAIVLNDNLLRRATLPEIEAVMGHEMGHYVLGHLYQFLIFFALVILAGFAVLRVAFARALDALGRPMGRSRYRGPGRASADHADLLGSTSGPHARSQ